MRPSRGLRPCQVTTMRGLNPELVMLPGTYVMLVMVGRPLAALVGTTMDCASNRSHGLLAYGRRSIAGDVASATIDMRMWACSASARRIAFTGPPTKIDSRPVCSVELDSAARPAERSVGIE